LFAEFVKPIISGLSSNSSTVLDLETTVNEIEEHLRCLRESAQRPEKLEEMTPSEITAEKLSLQRALVYLENKHGRPATPEDKKIVWSLYDRYRSVKRAIVRLGMVGTACALCTELCIQTLHPDYRYESRASLLSCFVSTNS
jgi:hypothetical protein